jgi:ABC-2 type transport system ATP-binding protein
MVAVTEMTNLAVDLIDVRKTYDRRIQALKGVSIQIGRGEIFGLLGPNGAGKSTLVKIMMTVVRADRADGTLLGRPIGHRGKLARIGYLPEDHRFPPYLTGRQVLDFYAALARVPKALRRTNADRLLEAVGMRDWGHTRISKYSKGMLQRLGLAQSLMNDPELVVLDEPTDGLDPVGRLGVREMLLSLKKRGVTVLLNSHLLSELEMVCDRVAILAGGLVVRQGTLSQLTEHTLEYRIVCASDPAAAMAELAPLGVRLDERTLRLSGQDAEKVNRVIDVLRAKGVIIESVVPKRFSLEDIFLDALGGDGKVASQVAGGRRS